MLTSGSHTFTGDLRFSSRHSQATHQAGVDSWILQIKPTQLKDAGEYQCQVNTEPKISFSVFLRVKGKIIVLFRAAGGTAQLVEALDSHHEIRGSNPI